MAFNWTCPFCSMSQTVTSEKFSLTTGLFELGDDIAEGRVAIEGHATSCSNGLCRKTTIEVMIGSPKFLSGSFRGVDNDKVILNTQIRPQALIKPQPDYIPAALIEDYNEACLIRNLSPKASATLTRRCLQGMIRHFCGITKGRLIDEINALRESVDDGTADRSISIESVDAIDAVRGIGNIGAHMEKNIDHIIDVEPGEAQAMIELIELLFAEWYIAKHKRSERFRRLDQIAASKESAKQVGISAVSALPAPTHKDAEK